MTAETENGEPLAVKAEEQAVYIGDAIAHFHGSSIGLNMNKEICEQQGITSGTYVRVYVIPLPVKTKGRMKRAKEE